MSPGYVREKLFVAVDTLATGTGSIQKRITDAWVSALMRLKAEDFLPEDRDVFTALRDQMVGHGTFEEATARMSDDEAHEHARRIVELNGLGSYGED